MSVVTDEAESRLSCTFINKNLPLNSQRKFCKKLFIKKCSKTPEHFAQRANDNFIEPILAIQFQIVLISRKAENFLIDGFIREKSYVGRIFSHSLFLSGKRCKWNVCSGLKIMGGSYANISYGPRIRPKALYVNMAKLAAVFHAFYFSTTATVPMMLCLITEQTGGLARVNIRGRSNSVVVKRRIFRSRVLVF